MEIDKYQAFKLLDSKHSVYHCHLYQTVTHTKILHILACYHWTTHSIIV